MIAEVVAMKFYRTWFGGEICGLIELIMSETH